MISHIREVIMDTHLLNESTMSIGDAIVHMGPKPGGKHRSHYRFAT